MINLEGLGKCDLHMHTVYCDGKNTPEEMVLSAIDKGLFSVGIATHSFTDIDTSYCIKEKDVSVFQKEVRFLKEKYADKICVLCGVEQDYFSNHPTDGFDYVIGSVHYFEVNGKYYDVDRGEKYLVDLIDNVFCGDFYALAENYYQKVGDLVEKTGADIIGHFDLISKFNRDGKIFDEHDPRYKEIYQKAILKLLPANKPFELNVGAIARGYKEYPYPNADMIEFIKKNGGKLIISSDAHNKENIAYEFSKWQKLL